MSILLLIVLIIAITYAVFNDDGEYLSNYGSYDEPDSKDYEQDYYASASLFISPYYCSNQLARKINKALEASDSLFELL